MAKSDVSDDQNINEDVEEVQPEQPETPEEPTPVEQEEQEDPEEQPEEIEEEPPKSRRLQKREDQLEEKLKIHNLLADLKRTPAPRQQVQGLNYGETLDADPQLVQQLENDRQSFGNQAFSQGIGQAQTIEWKMGLRIDTPQVKEKHKELDPQDPSFEPAIADALNEEYLYMVGWDDTTQTVQNPNLSYANFVEARYELANRMAGRKVQESAKNIARQSAMTGLRPDGSSAKRLDLNKDPSDMTMEELYAVTGAAGPKK